MFLASISSCILSFQFLWGFGTDNVIVHTQVCRDQCPPGNTPPPANCLEIIYSFGRSWVLDCDWSFCHQRMVSYKVFDPIVHSLTLCFLLVSVTSGYRQLTRSGRNGIAVLPERQGYEPPNERLLTVSRIPDNIAKEQLRRQCKNVEHDEQS